MARPLRLEYVGALYHRTALGNARHAIFLDDEDRRGFLGLLEPVVSRCRLVLHTSSKVLPPHDAFFCRIDAAIALALRKAAPIQSL